MSVADIDPRLIQNSGGIGGYWTLFKRRVSGGDLGSLPVVIGLIIIWTIFQSMNSNFLTALNLTNLMLQVAAVGMIAVGVFMVLLLGETDLSVGSVSGLSASVMAVLSVSHGVDPVLSIVLALLVGAGCGLVHGFFFTKFGVPAFIVTLAGLIGWQGVQLRVLGTTGTINLPDNAITDLTTKFMPAGVGWAIGIATIVIYVAAQLWETKQRVAANLRPRPTIEIIMRSVVVGAAIVAAVAILNHDRGVPLAVLIFVGFVVFFDLLTRRTKYGRHLYAVGGNAEAARRAGINVSAIRVSAFVIAGVMAAAGGIMAASRLFAVNQSSGGSDTLLNAIAAAVIGGTSLFGGRGRAYSALLGMLVIGSISNGLDLLGKSSSTKFMITGAVLLVAVTIDAVGRRGRQSSGRS